MVFWVATFIEYLKMEDNLCKINFEPKIILLSIYIGFGNVHCNSNRVLRVYNKHND